MKHNKLLVLFTVILLISMAGLASVKADSIVGSNPTGNGNQWSEWYNMYNVVGTVWCSGQFTGDGSVLTSCTFQMTNYIMFDFSNPSPTGYIRAVCFNSSYDLVAVGDPVNVATMVWTMNPELYNFTFNGAYVLQNGLGTNMLSWLQINGPGNVTLGGAGVARLLPKSSSQLFGIDTLAVSPDGMWILASNPTLSNGTNLLAVVNASTFAVAPLNASLALPAGVAFVPTSILAADIDGDKLADLVTVVGSRWYFWFSTAQYQRFGPYDLGIGGARGAAARYVPLVVGGNRTALPCRSGRRDIAIARVAVRHPTADALLSPFRHVSLLLRVFGRRVGDRGRSRREENRRRLGRPPLETDRAGIAGSGCHGDRDAHRGLRGRERCCARSADRALGGRACGGDLGRRGRVDDARVAK